MLVAILYAVCAHPSGILTTVTTDRFRSKAVSAYPQSTEITDSRGNVSYNYPEVPTDFEAMTCRLDGARRQGEINRQLDQASIVRQGWFARQGHQVLHQVGHLLVTVGERLDQDALPTPSVEV